MKNLIQTLFSTAVLFSAALSLSNCSGQDIPPVEEKPVAKLELTTPAEVVFTSGNNSGTITMNSNVSWTAKSDKDWCKISPESGKGNVNISVTLLENQTTTERTATVTVTGDGVPTTTAATRSTDNATTRASGAQSVSVTVKQSAVPVTKVTFKNIHANAKNAELLYASGATATVILADDKSVQVPALGMLTSAKFFHKDDGKTVVDWYDSKLGADTKQPVTIDLNTFAGGAGTQAEPYLVANPRQLTNTKLAGEGKYFKQIADINLTEACGIYPNDKLSGWDNTKDNPKAPFYNDKKGWVEFSLTATLYDGDNLKIIGLRTNGSLFDVFKGSLKNLIIDASSFVAGPAPFCKHLFPYNGSGGADNCVNNAKVRNQTVTLFDRFIHGDAGLFMMIYSGATVKNCTNNGYIESTKGADPQWHKFIGGICSVAEKGVTLENCTNNGKIYVTCDDGGGIGGIAGAFSGVGKNLINTADITENGSIETLYSFAKQIGGIVGLGSPNLENCTNKGKVRLESPFIKFEHRAGGIVGAGESNLIVKGCKNEGEITSVMENGQSVAGIVCGSSFNSQISDCINTANITCKVGQAAGITCNLDGSSKMVNCTNNGNITAENYVAGIISYNSGGTVQQCKNTGKITNPLNPEVHYDLYTSSFKSAAGIISLSSGGTITGCTNNGLVSGGIFTGGIIGRLVLYPTLISDHVNTGNIVGISSFKWLDGKVIQTDHRYAGAIIGLAEQIIILPANCQNTGTVTGDYINKFPNIGDLWPWRN